MWKKCNKCQYIKSIDNFYWRDKIKGTKRRVCKQCTNKQITQRRRDSKEKFDKWKDSLVCTMCGESRGPCLVFHHNQGIKNNSVSNLVKNNQIYCAMQEIKLTQILCHNCHMIQHNNLSYEDNGSSSRKTQLKNRAWWHEELLKTGCIKCGFKANAWALQSHHINPTTKIMGLSRMITNAGLSRIKEEFNKCVTLCANCHMEFHYLNHNNNIDLNIYLLN